MGLYDNEAVAHLYERVEHARWETSEIASPFLSRDFKTEKGREYARYGVGRRLLTLRTCIDHVYKLLPPEAEEMPSIANVQLAEIVIQSYVIHIYGVLDNLAWLIVLEKPLRDHQGREFANEMVGIQKKVVQQSLSPEFKKFLNDAKKWFVYLNNFRHSLAHRIPMYIPRGNYLEDEGITVFHPVMLHSFVESVGTIGFHGQMLNDLATVFEAAKLTIKEL